MSVRKIVVLHLLCCLKTKRLTYRLWITWILSYIPSWLLLSESLAVDVDFDFKFVDPASFSSSSLLSLMVCPFFLLEYNLKIGKLLENFNFCVVFLFTYVFLVIAMENTRHVFGDATILTLVPIQKLAAIQTLANVGVAT